MADNLPTKKNNFLLQAVFIALLLLLGAIIIFDREQTLVVLRRADWAVLFLAIIFSFISRYS